MISTGMPRALKRTLTAVAVAPLLAGLPVTAAQAASPSSSAAGSQTVSYLGHDFTVPASWTVVDLASAPETCGRFDKHVVYLGSQVPSRIVRRT
jgi:hypothetical protein